MLSAYSTLADKERLAQLRGELADLSAEIAAAGEEGAGHT